MLQLTQLTDDYSQQYSITTEDNYVFDFLLEFKVSQTSWFWSLAYNNFAINGQRLVLDPNLLRRFNAYTPFGLSCVTFNALKADPFSVTDFTSTRIQMFTLTQTEVNQINNQLYGQ